jgi:KDO2-lipid IV(A) lauroyltransferase
LKAGGHHGERAMKKKLLKQILKIIDIFFIGYFRLIRFLANILPPSVLYGIHSGLSFVLFYCVPGTRKRYYKNISQALPEIEDPGRIKYIARRSQDELFKSLVDLAVFARHGDQIDNELLIDGMDVVEKALALGVGAICVSGHLGAWSISFALQVRHGYLTTPIIINPDKTFTPRFVRETIDFANRVSGECGEYILTGQDNTISKTQELLKRGGILASAVDVTGRHIVDFLGKPAAMASGVGHFLIDSGVPVVPGYTLREKGGPLKFRGVFREPIDYSLTGDREKDIHAVLQACVAAIEEQVRLTPEQWTQWGSVGAWWKRAEELQKRAGAAR